MPGDETRASDSEREAVVAQLQTAHAEGRLDDTELSERIGAALRARTRGELAMLTGDLPGGTAGEPSAGPVAPVEPPAPPTPQRAATRQAWTVWAAANSVVVTVWLIVAVTSGSTYPWFLWVAGPWAAVLLAKTLTGRFDDA